MNHAEHDVTPEQPNAERGTLDIKTKDIDISSLY
jgi:hypothetical protein